MINSLTGKKRRRVTRLTNRKRRANSLNLKLRDHVMKLQFCALNWSYLTSFSMNLFYLVLFKRIFDMNNGFYKNIDTLDYLLAIYIDYIIRCHSNFLFFYSLDAFIIFH